MANRTIRCTICPIGCQISVEIRKDFCTVIRGHKCKAGIEYTKTESLVPKRMVTTSVLVEGGNWDLVSVRTTCPVPKDKIFPIMGIIKKMRVKAPVKLGETLIGNIAGTEADIIATKKVMRKL